MADEVPLGRRFSHLYMVPADKLPDSLTMRKRTHRAFAQFFEDSGDIAEYLDREMGIDLCEHSPYSTWANWSFFETCEVKHLLDAVTLVAQFLLRTGGTLDANKLRVEIARIFAEEHVAYRLDAQCGIHPQVDAAHGAALDTAIRHLDGAQFAAARTHIERADLSLLPGKNPRDSVRAIFDAAENVFKQTFKGAISLNKDNIEKHLKPALKQLYVEGAPLRAAQKMADALQHWADGCHNYRHETGQTEEIAPPEPLVVVAVAQGLGFVRWLADINREVAKSG